VTRAFSNSSIRSFFSSISRRWASASVQTPGRPCAASVFCRKRTGFPVTVACWNPPASTRTTTRSPRSVIVPFVSTTLPSKVLTCGALVCAHAVRFELRGLVAVGALGGRRGRRKRKRRGRARRHAPAVGERDHRLAGGFFFAGSNRPRTWSRRNNCQVSL
jgi:hypothetical protein